jgi:mannose-6-phosphate isomerase
MFVGITNTPRDYAWGSHTAIAELLGRVPSGGPEAELWLGAHPGSPSVIVDPVTVGADNLAEWIAADPAVALGSATATRLPFLLKVLAAASPLSLQAHPTIEQAREGFARENAAGVPADAPFRNYKDAYPKPELVFALSETYDALCGFRSAKLVRASLDVMEANGDGFEPLLEGIRARLVDDSAIAETFEWLISRGEGVDELTARVVELAAVSSGAEFETVGVLAAEYPGDPGIVISLLVNRVTLKRGEVLYLPAGNIHAYLRGLGIELMAASDNVLRGGLTPKYVDVPELIRVLDFTPLPVPFLEATRPSDGVEVYTPDVPDFVLVHVVASEATVGAEFALDGPAIALCVSGEVVVAGGVSGATVARGEAVYVTPDEGVLRFSGAGELFLATTGR